MSLHYFLSCKKNYVKIIQKLEYIIETLDDINYISICELQDDCLEKDNKVFFTDKIKYFQDLVNDCNNYLDQLCCHNYVDDTIDIDEDRCQNITYCTICETVKTE